MDKNDELRKRAIELLSTKTVDNSKWGNDVKQLIEEISIYQIELEHQNEALAVSQENLAKVKDQYFDLFENAPVSHVILNSDHVITAANNTFCKLFRLSKDDVIGAPFKQLVSPLFQDTFYHFCRLLQKGDLSAQIDLKMRSSRRGDIYVKIDATGQFGSNEYRLAITDISLQKKLENQLRNETEKAIKNEEKFRQLIERSSDIFFYQNIDTRRFEYINDRVFDILGFTVDEAMRLSEKNQASLFLPQYREEYYNLVDNIIRKEISGNGLYVKEFEIVTKNNEVKWLKGTYSIVRDNSQTPIQIVGGLQDITSSRIKETHLIEEKNFAQSSNNYKSTFLANMSHELRTPLNAIVGFAGLLKENLEEEKNPNDEFLQYISIIEKNGKILADMIGDIVCISKLESGMMTLKKSNFDVNSLLQDSFTIFNLEAKAKKLDFKYIPLKNNVTLNADKEKLTSVVNNLIKNSLKYTEKGGITFWFEDRDKELVFYIKDTGIGIPDDKKKMIFNRFNQVNQTSTTDGVGLGLNIVKGLLDLWGGTIDLESKLDVGSTFHFTIPK